MRCTNCGWNNPDGLSKCQKCNQPLEISSAPAPIENNGPVEQKRNLTATIRDVNEVLDRKATVREVKVGLKLTPVDGEGSSISLDNNAVLGKNEIDPTNPSISSKQLEVILDGSCVKIKDVSSLGNTYMQVKEETSVKAGDILLIGNRRYVVE